MTVELNQIIESRDLGSLNQITEIVNKIKSRDYSYHDLESFCRQGEYGFMKSLPGIFLLLGYVNFIEERENDNQKIIAKNTLGDYIEKEIIERLFERLYKDKVLHKIINPNKLDDKNSNTIISSINSYYSSIRDLLTSLNFLLQKNGIYFINDNYKQYFSDQLLSMIENSDLNQNRSEARRISRHARDMELGDDAEEYVLQYEKNLRNLHKSREKIRIVSKEDSGCGYDIKSYLDDKSLALTKKIEVKSYTSTRDSNAYFHWSYKQIETAEKYKETYFLYIIDRSKIEEDNYEPLIVKNPYRNIYKSDDWDKEPDGSLMVKKIS